jgi:hypothetical protein
MARAKLYISKVCVAAVVGITSIVGVMIMGGCKAAPPPAHRADYSQTLNKYYEGRPMCLWPETVKFPVEGAGQDKIQQLRLAGLANAGLLIMKPAGKGAKMFELSPEGRSALNPDVFNPGAGNFCYGWRKIVSIDAARRNTSTTELVDYHYSVAHPASWATEVSVQRAFPQVAAELAGAHMGQATLLDTVDGWEISGTPAIVSESARPAMMAKATGSIGLRKAIATSAVP